MQDVLQFAYAVLEEGKTVALVTVTGTQGSSPATPGQMMAVAEDGRTAGTVGGGASEHKLVLRAIDAVQKSEHTFAFSFDHSQDGMVCGGGMEGFGNVLGTGLKLLLFGGGHVAQKIAPLANSIGFGVTVVEDRPELAADFEHVQYLVCTPQEYSQKVHTDQHTYAVICTRGHRTDDVALRFLLDKPLAYVGMIGSKNKVDALFASLKASGIEAGQLEHVYAPVGLDIASGTPAEIAISVVAEILLLKNKGTLHHKRAMP